MGGQTDSCLQQAAGKQTVDGKACTNQWAVCHSRIKGVGRLECGRYIDWSEVPDSELRSYAVYNSISIPSPYNRDVMLANLMAWKASFAGQH